jgi:hypothetical protein
VIAEIACISDSIVCSMIPIRAMEHITLEKTLAQLELTTLCVSKYTLDIILKAKMAGSFKHLKNVICFDTLDQRTEKDLFETVKYQRCVKLYTYD